MACTLHHFDDENPQGSNHVTEQQLNQLQDQVHQLSSYLRWMSFNTKQLIVDWDAGYLFVQEKWECTLTLWNDSKLYFNTDTFEELWDLLDDTRKTLFVKPKSK